MRTIPECRRRDIIVQELENETLIYDLSISKAFCLNETSAMVYRLSDGTRTVAEITGLMSEQLNSPVSEDLVWLALQEL